MRYIDGVSGTGSLSVGHQPKLEVVADQSCSQSVFTYSAADRHWCDPHRWVLSVGDDSLPSDDSPGPLRERNRASIGNPHLIVKTLKEELPFRFIILIIIFLLKAL